MAENTISVRTKQIDKDDLPLIATQICEEYDQRKKNRKPLEDRWKEVDRQLRVEPELSHKMSANGKTDPDKKWLPETELPLQAQTLEMLTADARRLMLPKGREWFTARAALTSDYLQAFANAETPIPREKGRFEGDINQDNADQIAKAALSHYHAQYDLRKHIDLINTEAFCYSFGVGRVVPVKKRIMGHTMKGRPSNVEVPMLLPRSVKNVYLDDSQHAIMHEGVVVGPNIILHRNVKLADLKATALNDDSYIPEQISKLVPNKSGEVELIEMEGDLVYETSAETVVIRDVKITAARADSSGKATYGIIRTQESDGCSYLVFDYQLEDTVSRYGSSPLLKGAPINRIAAQLMNRLLESGSLKNAPPIGYPRDDPHFAASGGPVIHPNAAWETTEALQIYDEVGGDPSIFLNAFQSMVGMYYDVSGVNPPRLGAQTKSHTTAFAKDVEMSQGSIRTVDYVGATLEGPMQRFLEMEYRMAKKRWSKQICYVEAWKEFVELERAHLPDIVRFEAFGASAPAEELAEQQRKMNGIQTALQVDLMAVQMGKEPKLDHGAIIDRILRDAGFQDITEITQESEPVEGPVSGQIPGLAAVPPV